MGNGGIGGRRDFKSFCVMVLCGNLMGIEIGAYCHCLFLVLVIVFPISCTLNGF